LASTQPATCVLILLYKCDSTFYMCPHTTTYM
jgi:hypothetical protein